MMSRTTTSDVAILGDNQYGKAEVRLVHIDRATPKHAITDFNVSSQLRGDLEAIHVEGDNANCVATDTQKNTIYSLSRDGVSSPEEFALRLGDHFTSRYDWITGGRWAVEKYSWIRIETGEGPHDHSFVRSGTEVRTTVVQRDGDDAFVVSGLQDLTVLKSTGSEFVGFHDDEYRTLSDATDRILATDVKARWRYTSTDLDFDEVFADVRRLMLAEFAKQHSYALQQTLYQMGIAVLEAHPYIAEIRMSMPNNHHFLVDLSPFGQDNPNVVFFAADRPYGLIEAEVRRKDATPEPRAWDTVTGFC